MLFLLYCFIAAVIGFLVSLLFRRYEIQKGRTYTWIQFTVQTVLFIVFIWWAYQLFRDHQITLGFINLNWIWSFVLLETLFSLLLQILYERASGNKLFNEPKAK